MLIRLSNALNQPQGAPRINWSNPLARGLRGLVWASSRLRPYDVLNPGLSITGGVSTTAVTTRRGRAWNVGGTGLNGIYSARQNTSEQAAMPAWFPSAPPITFAAYYDVTSYTNSGIFGVMGNSNLGYQAVSVFAGVNNRYLVANTVTSDAGTVWSTGIGLRAGIITTTDMVGYDNGYTWAKGSGVASLAYDTTFSRVQLVRGGSDYDGQLGDGYWLAVWHRALSLSELDQLNAYPWSLIEHAPRKSFFIVSGGSVYSVAFNDSVAASDANSATAQRPATAADSVATSDTTAVTAQRPAAADDSVATSDTATAAATRVGAAADSVTTSDTATAAATRVGAVTDSVATSDVRSATAQRPATAADSVATSDVSSTTAQRPATVSDSVTVTDSVNWGAATYIVATDDSVSAGDVLAAIMSAAAATADSAAAATSHASTALRVAAFADSVAAADAMAAAANMLAGWADGVAVTDAWTGTLPAVINVAFSDIVTVGDSFAAALVPGGVVILSAPLARQLIQTQGRTTLRPTRRITPKGGTR